MTNGKISLRQMGRLLFFDVLGIGLVALPELLAGTAGTNGVFAIALGSLFSFGYLFLLEKAMEPQRDGKVWIYGVYGIFLLLAGGYGLSLLAELIKKYLLPDQSFGLITILLLALILYSKNGGLEGRARVFEVLFWPMIVLLFLLVSLGFRGIELENLLPLQSSGGGFWKGVYVWFLMCSAVQIIFFLPPYMEAGATTKQMRNQGISALALGSGVLMVIYEMLLGSFGEQALSHAKTPIMIYTSNIIMPGGFLRRQEALIAGVCFVSLLSFIGSGFCYGALCLKKIKEKKWVTWISIILLFLVALTEHYRAEGKPGVGVLLLVLTPMALFLPFFIGKGLRRAKAVALAFTVMISGLFTGCSVKELEDRSFPMIMSLQAKDDTCVLSYQFMNLSKISDKDKAGQKTPTLQMEGVSVSAAIYEMDMQWGKVLDLNHLKVLLLEESFLKNEKLMQGLVEKGNSGVELPGNMLVFVAEDNEKITELQEKMEDDLGSYLEELMQGNPNYKTSGGTTFKQLICDWYNGNGNTVLPVIEIKDEVPVVGGYDLIQSQELGENYQIHRVREEDGLVANLCDGEANALDITVDDGRIHMENVGVSYEFSRSNTYVLCNVYITGDIVKSESTADDAKKNRKMATDYFVGEIQNAWKKDGIDLTNSYYHLRSHDRDLYERYKEHYEDYEKDLHLEVSTKFKMVE